MSIPTLIQTQEEVRRLCVAGGGLAAGDFRLKKLITPLKASGEKAPVFAKIAEAAEAVVEATDKTAPQALLQLASLTSAVLATQANNGAAGEMQPIATLDIPLTKTQASARQLQPVLHALRTTGSGRVEIIKQAIEQGTFRDPRLLPAAVDGLNDFNNEIAALLGEHVLPQFGAAVFDEVRSLFDLSRGHRIDIRYLNLMHRIDPIKTRPFVKQAITEGTREICDAAINLLGEEDEDVELLLSAASSKAKGVRNTALRCLARLDHPQAVPVVKQAALQSDERSFFMCLAETKSRELADFVIVEAGKQLDGLLATKDAESQRMQTSRIQHWVRALLDRKDDAAIALINRFFDCAPALSKIKGDPCGQDVNESVIQLMCRADEATLRRVLATRKSLSTTALRTVFEHVLNHRPASEAYDLFCDVVKRPPPQKATKATADQRERYLAVCTLLSAAASRNKFSANQTRLDDRWLDAAIDGDALDLVRDLERPNHTRLLTYLSRKFKTTTGLERWSILPTIISVQHPDAIKHAIEFLRIPEKVAASHGLRGYWARSLTARLPPSAIPALEAALPSLDATTSTIVLEAIEEIRAKARENPTPTT